MSESRPAFKHTSGNWGKHPSFDFKVNGCVSEGGAAWAYCHVYLAAGEKIIAQVILQTTDPKIGGYPHVDNLIEMKANLALMSAAPDMLKFISDELHRVESGCDAHCWPEYLETLRRIIAKATTF